MNTLFKSIIQTCSTPGNEVKLRNFLIDQFKPYGTIHKSKWTSFYCAHKNNTKNENRLKIVVTAHMDSPGFIVRNIEDEGIITFISLGGIAPKTGNMRTVQLHSSDKVYSGIITLNEEDEKEYQDATYSGFFGFDSAEDVRKAGIKIGDSACFEAPVMELQNGLIMAPHLDNRLGIYLLLEIAKEIENEKLDCDIYYAATGAEEMGGRGARILANMIQPDIAICLDATYESKFVKMGKGAVFTLSDASVLIPTNLRDQVEKIATKNNIPLQYEVYNYSGTDAKDFKDVGDGCLTICLLIATLYNHGPHEICSWKDIEYTKQMIKAIILNNDKLTV